MFYVTIKSTANSLLLLQIQNECLQEYEEIYLYKKSTSCFIFEANYSVLSTSFAEKKHNLNKKKSINGKLIYFLFILLLL